MLIRASSGSGGGGGNVKTGTFLADGGNSHTFDCGITDPDLVLIFDSRQSSLNGNWITFYNTATLFSGYSGCTNAKVIGSGSAADQNCVSVSGSNVTANTYFGPSGTTTYWLAYKSS